jgi:hypothetical protein
MLLLLLLLQQQQKQFVWFRPQSGGIYGNPAKTIEYLIR